MSSCPICKFDPIGIERKGDRVEIECPRCGPFEIAATVEHTGFGSAAGPQLSAWVRQQHERGAEPPYFGSHKIPEVAAALPTYSAADKQTLLLRAIAQKSKHPGDVVRIVESMDIPLAWAASERELEFYLKALGERKLLEHLPHATMAETDYPVQVSATGWSFLDDRARQPLLSDQVFVAMSFSAALLPVWTDAIRPAIEDAGYNPRRIDSLPHNQKIDDKIIAEIRASRFVVADFTDHRQGVYFEAGFALGLGLEVIWTVKKTDLSNTHFDTRQYNHIDWIDEPDLRDRLYTHICAIIGKNRGK